MRCNYILTNNKRSDTLMKYLYSNVFLVFEIVTLSRNDLGKVYPKNMENLYIMRRFNHMNSNN